MRLGTVRKPYVLPPRRLFDVVAANDVTSLLTAVRGVNPFDESPGMKIILSKMDEVRPESANLYVEYTNEVEIDPKAIADATDERGNTPLHVAAQHGYAHLLDVLYHECSCPLETRNLDGFTALHLAAMFGRLECVKLLCEVGANTESVTYTESPDLCEVDSFFLHRSPLFLAHWHQHHTVASYLTATHPPTSPVVRSRSAADGGDAAPSAQRHDNAIYAAYEEQDMLTFVLLFDYLDCLRKPCGELPLKWGGSAVPVLASTAPKLLQQIAAKSSSLSATDSFIFDALVSRDFLRAMRSIVPQLAEKVTQNGHFSALRSLVQCGAVTAADLDRLAPLSASGDGELALALAEWLAERRYMDALDHYKTSKSKSRKTAKEAAYQCKVAWRHAARARESVRIASLSSLLSSDGEKTS